MNQQPATPTTEEKSPCACLNGCHTTAATPSESATQQQIITNLLNLISSITNTTLDGRIEPYCGGNCSMVADLRDVADFSAVQEARDCLAVGFADTPVQDARDQLRDRIADICCGACGRFVDDEDQTLAVEELSRVIPAIMESWSNLPAWVFYPHNLKHFTTVDSITDFIFGALKG